MKRSIQISDIALGQSILSEIIPMGEAPKLTRIPLRSTGSMLSKETKKVISPTPVPNFESESDSLQLDLSLDIPPIPRQKNP